MYSDDGIKHGSFGTEAPMREVSRTTLTKHRLYLVITAVIVTIVTWLLTPCLKNYSDHISITGSVITTLAFIVGIWQIWLTKDAAEAATEAAEKAMRDAAEAATKAAEKARRETAEVLSKSHMSYFRLNLESANELIRQIEMGLAHKSWRAVQLRLSDLTFTLFRISELTPSNDPRIVGLARTFQGFMEIYSNNAEGKSSKLTEIDKKKWGDAITSIKEIVEQQLSPFLREIANPVEALTNDQQ